MSQYTAYTVSVTKNSNIVMGSDPNIAFTRYVTAGNSFKVSEDTVIYQISSVVSDTEIHLTAPYAGLTKDLVAYQISRDFTPNYGLAEINVGDRDWPIHLTVGTIRKIDQILANLGQGYVVKGSWNASTNTPTLPEASVDNLGWMYVVTANGNTVIDGVSSWVVGDTVMSDGSVWFKIPAVEPVVRALALEAEESADAAYDSKNAAAASAAAAAASAVAAAASAVSMREVTTSTVNASGHLIISFSDSTSIDAGIVRGLGVQSILRTSGTGAPGTLDTYTITYTDTTATTFSVYNGADGVGSGDMLASLYDSDSDGKVDAAELADNVDWTGVLNRPSTYTPSAHTTLSHSDWPATVSMVEVGYLDGVSSSIQTQLNDKAASTHVHGNITNTGYLGSTAGIPLITGVGGVIQAGAFGSTAGSFCQGNDSRLSDARTPLSHTTLSHSDWPATVSMVEVGYLDGVTSAIQTQITNKAASTHVHGNITNTGYLGSTAGIPLITGVGGVIQAGAFGSTAGSFCQGNDSRLSDARTPLSHTTLSHSDWPATVSMVEVGYLDGVTSAIQTQLGTKAGLSANTFTGVQTFVGIKETKTAIAASAIDLALGSVFTKTISGATTFTVSNTPASGAVGSFILELTNGGSSTVTWWGGVKWAGGTPPTLTTSGIDVLGFYTHDGGTTWRGMVLAKDSK